MLVTRNHVFEQALEEAKIELAKMLAKINNKTLVTKDELLEFFDEYIEKHNLKRKLIIQIETAKRIILQNDIKDKESIKRVIISALITIL